MGPQPLPQVAALPPYVPGKPPTPRPGLRTYKISSNENPFQPLPGVLEAAQAAAAEMNRYPDMGCSELYGELSARLGVAEDELAAGAGSVALIFHLLAAFSGPGDEVVHAWRSFEAYPIAVAAAGATGVEVPLAPGARHDLDAMAAAITERTKVVLLCTPNNPTGAALSHAEVAAFVARVPSDVLVVVDEAYREFVRMADPVDGPALRRSHDNVVVLRTFSKAYGLAGLRVGYAVAHPVVASAVRAIAIPFGVSTIAQAAAIASLRAEDMLLERVEGIVAERERLVQGAAAAGWSVPDPQGNFVWLEPADLPGFLAAGEEEGLSLRPFAGEGIRVTVAESEATNRLLALLERIPPPDAAS